MGRVFIEWPHSNNLYYCGYQGCNVPLAKKSSIISSRFTGSTGKAFLFSTVVNATHSEKALERQMLTGRHFVRDVSCKKCKTKLGWFYEFAAEERQRYKEGKVVLERALLTDKVGINGGIMIENSESQPSPENSD